LLKTKNTLILATILAFALGTTIIHAQETDPSLYYGGVTTEASGTYTFTYTVVSRTTIITKWLLKSSFFERTDIQIHITAQDELVDSPSFIPLYIHNPTLGTLELDHSSDHKFNESLIRNYEITVYANDYAGITVDEIEYQIQLSSSNPVAGTITGPIDTAEIIVEPPPWYNNIPPITIPIGFILLLVIAWRLKWF